MQDDLTSIGFGPKKDRYLINVTGLSFWKLNNQGKLARAGVVPNAPDRKGVIGTVNVRQPVINVVDVEGNTYMGFGITITEVKQVLPYLTHQHELRMFCHENEIPDPFNVMAADKYREQFQLHYGKTYEEYCKNPQILQQTGR